MIGDHSVSHWMPRPWLFLQVKRTWCIPLRPTTFDSFFRSQLRGYFLWASSHLLAALHLPRALLTLCCNIIVNSRLRLSLGQRFTVVSPVTSTQWADSARVRLEHMDMCQAFEAGRRGLTAMLSLPGCITGNVTYSSWAPVSPHEEWK